MPKKARSDTEFEFKFYTDGVEYDPAPVYAYYHIFFKLADFFNLDRENGQIIFYVGSGLIVLTLLCCLVCCIKKCCCKKIPIVDSSMGVSSEMTQLAINKEEAERYLSVTTGRRESMELESIHGSDGDQNEGVQMMK